MGSVQLTLALVLVSLLYVDSSKPVVIRLDAKWPSTPILFEASEFVHDYEPSKFWAFVDSLAGASSLKTDEAVYNFVVEQASAMFSLVAVDLLKFSLATRRYSARAQVFQQLGLDEGVLTNCSPVFHFRSQFSCDFPSMLENDSEEQSGVEPVMYSVDHRYPGRSSKNQHTVILYGQLGSEPFHSAHNKLRSLAMEGRVRYLLRPWTKELPIMKTKLSGYGVELAIKSTEYKAVDDQKVKDSRSDNSFEAKKEEDELNGFIFSTLKNLHPELQDNLDQLSSHFKDSSKELASLKAWQLSEISFQAAARILLQKDGISSLKEMESLSQDFPLLVKSLIRVAVSNDLKQEVTQNQKLFRREELLPGQAAVYVNGRPADLEAFNLFSLMRIIQEEISTMERFEKLGLEGELVSKLSRLSLPDVSKPVLDLRFEHIQWLNNLETEYQYQSWPNDLSDLLQPVFPGMLHYVARNIHNLVLFLNPHDVEAHKVFLTFRDLLQDYTPARFGIVLVVDPKDHVGRCLARGFLAIRSSSDAKKAATFLTEVFNQVTNDQTISKDHIKKSFGRWSGHHSFDEILSYDEDFDPILERSWEFYTSTGLRSKASLFLNGQQFTPEEKSDVRNSILQKILSNTQVFQEALFRGTINKHASLDGFIYNKSNVVKRLTEAILIGEHKMVDLVHTHQSGSTLEDFASFSKQGSSQKTASVMSHIKYLPNDSGDITMWIVTDLDLPAGRTFLKEALSILKGLSATRIGVVFNPEAEPTSSSSVNVVVAGLMIMKGKMSTSFMKYVVDLLAELESSHDSVLDVAITLAENSEIFNRDKINNMFSSENHVGQIFNTIKSLRQFSTEVIGVQPGQLAVVSNGQVFGPVDVSEVFTSSDFDLIISLESGQVVSLLRNAIQGVDLDLPLDDGGRAQSDMVTRLSNVMHSQASTPRKRLPFKGEKFSVIKLDPKRPGPFLDIEAALDPLSKEAQKLSTVLRAITEAFNVRLRLFMNCAPSASEMPLNRFYRYVVDSFMQFDAEGKLTGLNVATFQSLPQSALLTLHLDTPQSWMVESVQANFDLDNIHLEQVDKGVYGDFELEHLLIEGHCSDGNTFSPPRGLQFILGPAQDPQLFDTIVMANLGYFQLKAYPGRFLLNVREGRSATIYHIDRISGMDNVSSQGNVSIVIDSFEGRFLRLQVKRNPGQEKADLLADQQVEETPDGIWQAFTTMMGGSSKKVEENETLDIFSVATGQLYERFLRIMMLSVVKHTRNPVKFWFLKNFLSPHFKNSLPRMARHFGFRYEYVQYQWPHWLNQQTDKQRIIWGYKILFLDVLFPLGVKKIIFVDADQIVRADLKELYEFDLDGAPYGYTPFCDDRREMDGYRFWKSGYWASHLQGQPYHISALYVVDLKQFRKMAAGDRLRGQYQGLSQDPNSLANLDQDLPNNMIHQVPIKSLPQEWLWCETWCSDDRKKYAKTIDMCNNPMTKEPKLDRAMRIAPEWKLYDEEIRKLTDDSSPEEAAKTPPFSRTGDLHEEF